MYLLRLYVLSKLDKYNLKFDEFSITNYYIHKQVYFMSTEDKKFIGVIQ